ncbi:hypothetical protein [Spirosoma sp.]|uniref:hypothetical protein n=1 Tax=Spirosoma sp. TaxID=1899569 RepID=UPI003B3BC138
MLYKKGYSVLFLIPLILVLGCSKKEVVDPRDQYIGTYATIVTYSQKVTATGSTTNGSLATSYLFAKGNSIDEILIKAANSTSTDIPTTIKLSGSTFTLAPYTAQGTVSGAPITFNVTGSGSFSGKSVNMTSTSTGGGIVLTANYSGSRP